jgi:S-adenosylmethionine hydrolase
VVEMTVTGTIGQIALITDFGYGGPYVGQVKLWLTARAPGLPVIELISDLPAFQPRLAAYLLPALARDVPLGTLYVCVVDPGVGGDRDVLWVEADGNHYLGPDNGLLALVAKQARDLALRRVDWRPSRLSPSFHGRDLFAPLAAKLAHGEAIGATPLRRERMVGQEWPDETAAVIYVDHYGNLITGLRGGRLDRQRLVNAGGYQLRYVRTFCEAAPGIPFWYEDAFGLVELAVNQGRADVTLNLGVGAEVVVDHR